ncbi:hypothetical protein [Bacterioplanoides sp.]|uniref:hypothetical protein n=1 Tax=Bacterioplanoides sp. TaxID=2066072 RepID=UPI003B0028A3
MSNEELKADTERLELLNKHLQAEINNLAAQERLTLKKAKWYEMVLFAGAIAGAFSLGIAFMKLNMGG